MNFERRNKIKPIRWWHWWQVWRLTGASIWTLWKQSVLFETIHYGWWHDGKLIAYGGIYLLWDRVGEGFLFLSEPAREHPVYLVFALKRIIRECQRRHGLRRLQAHVLDNNEDSMNLVYVLKFKAEGYHEAYGPNGDAHWSVAKVV